MKNLNSKIILFIVFASLFLFISQAKAEGTTTIQMKVAAFDQILFDNDFIVSSCPDQASSTNYTINAWCAIDQLISSKSWTATSTWYPYGIMLNSINQYEGDFINYWLWFSNSEPGETALNQHILSEGEKLLLSFGTSPLKITASDISPFINSTTTISAFYFDVSFWQWALAASTTFSINGLEIPSASGTYELWPNTTTAYEISAKEPGFIDSEPTIIIPQLPTININLRLETASSTLLNQNLAVLACEENAGNGIYSLNGKCAVEQSGLLNQWTDWGSDSFLDSIADFANNQDGNGIYWSWFKDLDYGQVALNKDILSENENLLLIYGISPLRITTATTTPAVNSTTTLFLEQFAYDSGWSPVWELAASSTFLIDGQEFFSEDGAFQLLVATTSPYLIFGKKAGYLDSPILTLAGIFQDEIIPPTPPDIPIPSGGSGGNPGANPGNAQTHKTADINKAINFLVLNQNSDGSIGSSIIYSDWAAIALSAFGGSDAKNKLKNYLSGAEYNTNGSITDLERRAMALMALSVNPYSETATDYISLILSAFDGTQIGDPELFNDDIFALFPLLKAGYSGSDPIIRAVLKFIISKQNTNGSWGNIDLTASAIQALSLAKKTGGLDTDIIDSIEQSLQLAKNFLKNSQTENGGFDNNAISTSWAIQAIVALGEQVQSWENTGNNSYDFLASRQNDDGGFEDVSIALDTRIWTTAYVIPAALGKTWDGIMQSFPKKTENLQNSNNANITQLEAAENLPVSPTSTPELSAATTTISTTTPMVLAATTTVFATTSINENVPEPQYATPAKLISATSTVSLETSQQLVANIPEVKIENEQNLSVDDSANSIPENEEIKEDYSKKLSAQISNGVNSGDSGGRKIIRIIFYLSAGISLLLGLYLLLKFLTHIFHIKKLH
ncbi:MAG: terpene cyclase/mutase family protein [Candidatus Pacebacteria bacterium]|nr:terpene cyclase/mutase family protein [Candidatus Paceibacterota bacterium]